MTNGHKMPVGIDDFKELRKGNYYFADKTQFIRDLIDNRGKVTLITRPRRFGKTLGLSMLRYFFSLEGSDENRHLFDGCNITLSPDHMALQGTVPTIVLSLKDSKQTTWQDTREKISLLMSKLYREYSFLQDSPLLDSVEKDSFKKVREKKASAVELEESLSDLCHMLRLHYGRQVLLLIDEYDAPIQCAWEHGFYDESINFMRNFLSSALKDNTDIDFAVITGVLRIAKESIFSALNNLDVCNIFSQRYADAMEFTKNEVSAMAEALGHTDKLSEIREWYDGYRFGNEEIYNPWSVINYFSNGCKPDIYWLNTSGNGIISELMAHRNDEDDKNLLSLLQGGTVLTALPEKFIYPELYHDRDALYAMLLFTGYMKISKLEYVFGEVAPICELSVPNLEVKQVYKQEIWNRFRGKLLQSDLLNVLRYMVCGQADAFSKGLEMYLQQIASCHDVARNRRPENFYHGFLLGITAWLMPAWQIKSNGESGDGRFDIQAYPLKDVKPGVCMEFKVAERKEHLDELAKKALLQMKEKNYLAEFSAKGVKEVWCYGIAFCGKHLKLVKG